MQIVIIGNDNQRNEFSNGPIPVGITWLSDLPGSNDRPDVIIDLLFENTTARIDALKKYLPALVVVNSVLHTISEIHPDFVRINGWTTFLQSSLIEAAWANIKLKERAEAVFGLFNKKLEWVPDEHGFITPRIISALINEAFYALEEEVSTKDEINLAMKLGTAYPYGPFEWAEQIGIDNIIVLLNHLSLTNTRYTPAPHLIKSKNK